MTIHELLGIELPVIQAPMAGVQDAELAATISNAGGLGSLPCAMLSIELLEAELHRLTSLTDGPFNLNFFCHDTPSVTADISANWGSIRRLSRPASPGNLSVQRHWSYSRLSGRK
jgi:nitronate monooxygenase